MSTLSDTPSSQRYRRSSNFNPTFIPEENRRESSRHANTAIVDLELQSPTRVEVKHARKDDHELIPIDDLYLQELNDNKQVLDVALRLLAQTIDYTDEALTAYLAGRDVDSDDAIQKIQGLLPVLFNCRVLGDSFGVIINALLSALENQQGIPLNEKQLQAVRYASTKLRAKPFMSFDSAIDVLSLLEDSGLNLDPPGFEYISDWLSE